ncbi:MAG: PAS domain-containing protein [Lachnospiraceae bacterium]|nr:PAS domain-containing protein [Lachnospiraceae bacterium]
MIQDFTQNNTESIITCCDFDFFLRFLEGLQRFLGDKCEILVHDFRKGYDHSITYEFNAKLSGRAVGGSPRGGMISNTGKDVEPYRDSLIFFYPGSNGQVFKSCTTVIADQNHKIVGSVCVNLEVSGLILAQESINQLVGYHDNLSFDDNSASVTQNVDEFLNHLIRQCELNIGKPMSMMSKQEKLAALAFLDDKGVFKISKTSNLLCEKLQISRYTLYAYLDEVRKNNDSQSTSGQINE